MKRIAGGFSLLLASLCGCISFTQPSQSEARKDTTELKHMPVRGVVGQMPPATATGYPGAGPSPSSPQWATPQDQQANQARGFDHTSARPSTQGNMPAHNTGR